jgi:pyruvoyl-dependent arginine decarboxylase (PvlArgDC)
MKNFRALLTQDLFKGEKEIAFAMMSSIQYKPASKMILGYIQFEVPGVATGNNFGSENSWTFDESLNGIAKEVADYCKKQVVEAHKPKVAQVVQQTSAADELLKYKQLLDAGVITQEEFDAKKKELLGL